MICSMERPTGAGAPARQLAWIVVTAALVGGGATAGVLALSGKLGTSHATVTTARVAPATPIARLGAGAPTTRQRSTARAGHVPVGEHPTGIAVDPASQTIYVADASNSVTLIDGRACNAATTSGCARPATIPSSQGNPLGVAVDPATDTIYVTNAASSSVSVVDGHTCSVARSGGCGAVATVSLGDGATPEFLTLDPASRTVYVADPGADAVSLLDARTCNAADVSGCGRRPRRVQVGAAPEIAFLDAANHTVYVADTGGDTVSLLDARTCNARVASGCGAPLRTATVGAGPLGIAVEPTTDTVYVGSSLTGTVAVLDGATCGAADTSDCSKRVVPVGGDPRAVVLDAPTHTVYVANARGSDVALFDAAGCNAATASGCDRPVHAATVGASPRRLAIDAASRTLYATNAEGNDVGLVDVARCNATTAAGC
jgi:DNA-binding beta-propeller fold protein YncE